MILLFDGWRLGWERCEFLLGKKCVSRQISPVAFGKILTRFYAPKNISTLLGLGTCDASLSGMRATRTGVGKEHSKIFRGAGRIWFTSGFWIFWLGLCVGEQVLASEDRNSPRPSVQVTFEGAKPDLAEKGLKIIQRAAACFEQITHKSIGKRSIRICFVDRIDGRDTLPASAGHLQGLTRHGDKNSIILISSNQLLPWGE